MMGVNIICVGKLKESYLRDACSEYAKRLCAFCKFNIIELAESRLSDNPSQKEIDSALSQEAKLMQPYLSAKGAYNIALCIEGKQLSSPELSKTIEKLSVHGFSIVNFVIGSSFGIDEDVKTQCRLRLSMSKMTFPHQLARVMLTEQIYRAFAILSNSKYHK